MMRVHRTALWLVLVLSLVPAWAAPPAPSDARAAALADFDFMVDYLRRNYAGWEHKVESSPERKAEFEALARRQREIIVVAPEQAGSAMRDLLAWFKDRHTGLESLGDPTRTQAEPMAKPAPPRTVPQVEAERIDAEGLRKRLARKDGRNPIQGLWESGDGNYRVAVLPKRAGQWRALVLQSEMKGWDEGQRKFTIDDAGKEAMPAT